MANKINWKQFWLELIAVLIGVTLAFQLQNWSEKRKDKAETKQYLKAISSDLELDIVELSHLIDTTSSHLAQSTKLIRTVSMRNFDQPDIFNQVMGMYNITAFRPKNSAFSSMSSAGKFNLVKDFDLRQDISDLYQWKYDELEIYDISHAEQFYGFTYPYISKNVAFRRNGFENTDFMQSNEFANLAFAAHFTNVRKNKQYTEAKELAKQLKANIDSVLTR